MKPDRQTCNVTLSLEGWTIWQDCYYPSHITCIVKTNSPCLSSHDGDVNTFRFQQATIFTATLLFQPQLITTLYIQLQRIIYKSSVYCFTHAQRSLVVRCKKSSDVPITTKDNTLLNLFLISVCCKCEHFWRSFLSSPLVLSCLTTAVIVFLLLLLLLLHDLSYLWLA